MGNTLYIVATPIGNLKDITLRALEVLRTADVVLCEDTRVTRKLLSHYEISARVESFHAHSTDGKVRKILNLLETNTAIALVTDAGTPGISDPGSELVARVRRELPDVAIVPIPGPSALSTILSAAGIESSEFVFLGFLPHKKGRETLFREIAAASRAMIFYESPHRILKALASLAGVLGPERTVVIGRELTKMHEEIVSGSAQDLLAHYERHPDRVRGEFVVIVDSPQ